MTRRVAALVVLGAALIGADQPQVLDFAFRDASGNVRRSTELHSWLPFSPRILVVHAPSRDDARLAKQLLAFAEGHEELRLIEVVSLDETDPASDGYAIDADDSEKVAAFLGEFGVALLDSHGRVILRSNEPIPSTRVRLPLDVSQTLLENRQELVLRRLLAALDPLYPPPDPLSCKRLSIEEETERFVQVAVRENHQPPCEGEPSVEPVIDRFRVTKPRATVQRWNAVDDTWRAVER